jgi:hypothetical protein
MCNRRRERHGVIVNEAAFMVSMYGDENGWSVYGKMSNYVTFGC